MRRPIGRLAPVPQGKGTYIPIGCSCGRFDPMGAQNHRIGQSGSSQSQRSQDDLEPIAISIRSLPHMSVAGIKLERKTTYTALSNLEKEWDRNVINKQLVCTQKCWGKG